MKSRRGRYSHRRTCVDDLKPRLGLLTTSEVRAISGSEPQFAGCNDGARRRIGSSVKPSDLSAERPKPAEIHRLNTDYDAPIALRRAECQVWSRTMTSRSSGRVMVDADPFDERARIGVRLGLPR